MSRQILAKTPRCFLSTSSLLLGTLFITACSGGAAGYFPAQHIAPKTELIDVENGRISVTPPPGFCKDRRGSKTTETSTFIIFANCGYLNSFGRRASGNASFTGLVTTSIAKAPAFTNGKDVNALSDFLTSGEGLEILSASGNDKTVSILDKRQTSDGIYLELYDTDAPLSKNIWKSFLNRSDHLVTVTLLQNKDVSLTSEQGMQFLQSYSETIRLNAKEPAPQPIAQIQPNQPSNKMANGTDQKNKLKHVGLLRRLLL